MFAGNKSDCVSGWEENNQFHRQNEAAWIFYSLQSKDVENIWETKDKQLVSDSSVIITWSCPLTVKKVSRSWWNFSSSAFLPMYLSTCMFVMEMIKRWLKDQPLYLLKCTISLAVPLETAHPQAKLATCCRLSRVFIVKWWSIDHQLHLTFILLTFSFFLTCKVPIHPSAHLLLIFELCF